MEQELKKTQEETCQQLKAIIDEKVADMAQNMPNVIMKTLYEMVRGRLLQLDNGGVLQLTFHDDASVRAWDRGGRAKMASPPDHHYYY